MPSTFDIIVGSAVWLDGQMWTVQEIAGASILVSNGKTLRRVGAALISRAHIGPDGEQDASVTEPMSLTLSRLSPARLKELHSLERELLGILDSDQAEGTTQSELVRQAAERQGVTVRTMRRKIAEYRSAGLPGLIDSLATRKYESRIDPRWDRACLVVLAELVYESTPTKKAVIGRVQRLLTEEFGPGVVTFPSRTVAYERVDELAKGRQAFGQGKARRSIAERPQGMYGRLRSQYPGEYVLLDSTPLDVFALEEGTGRWVSVELTVAIDLFSRCIVGLRLAPISTDSRDIADVLYQVVAPPEEDTRGFPYHGVPHNLIIGTGEDKAPLGAVPGTIVVDHGKAYLSDHVRGACARAGINIQPATPHKPTDKPAVERFFRTLRQSFLQHLPGYKGPDVHSRGDNVENKAVYYITELESMIRAWVTTVYHRSSHAGLCIPEVPGIALSPVEMFEAGLAKTGHLRLPASEDLVFDFLAVHWRSIQHYGVEIKGQRYDAVVLNKYRNMKSKERGANAGKWPFFYDTHDVRYVYFKDPDEHRWHRLEWEHAPMLDAPFSQKAAEYAREVARRENRHVDPEQAVFELLEKWRSKEILSRSDLNLSKRLMAKKHHGLVSKSKPLDDRTTSPERRPDEEAMEPLSRASRQKRAPRDQKTEERNSRVFDVFAEYYENNPDAELEVFE